MESMSLVTRDRVENKQPKQRRHWSSHHKQFPTDHCSKAPDALQ